MRQKRPGRDPERAEWELAAQRSRKSHNINAQGVNLGAQGANLGAQGANLGAQGADLSAQGANLSAQGADLGAHACIIGRLYEFYKLYQILCFLLKIGSSSADSRLGFHAQNLGFGSFLKRSFAFLGTTCKFSTLPENFHDSI